MYIFVKRKHEVPLAAETRKASVDTHDGVPSDRQGVTYVRHAHTPKRGSIWFAHRRPVRHICFCVWNRGIAGSGYGWFLHGGSATVLLASFRSFMCVLALPLVMCARSNGRKDNDP